MDWYLYDKGVLHERVNLTMQISISLLSTLVFSQVSSDFLKHVKQTGKFSR